MSFIVSRPARIPDHLEIMPSTIGKNHRTSSPPLPHHHWWLAGRQVENLHHLQCAHKASLHDTLRSKLNSQTKSSLPSTHLRSSSLHQRRSSSSCHSSPVHLLFLLSWNSLRRNSFVRKRRFSTAIISLTLTKFLTRRQSRLNEREDNRDG